ncbi:hypothetical protein [Oscillibacter ruminantium]|uniref:hypothetical protein n=1 Tax=Oscillibacter ruminantium TaxID=1263547 RepID=UPI0002EE318D|nr:hypothetical protein [Oscillibacter ruminantium]
MERCTWDDGRGNWGIRGVELSQLPPNAYGALYKLHDIERLVEAIQQEEDAACVSGLLWRLMATLGLNCVVTNAKA